ncbi:hypothetical protein Bca101_019024 [Brassica carinata]
MNAWIWSSSLHKLKKTIKSWTFKQIIIASSIMYVESLLGSSGFLLRKRKGEHIVLPAPHPQNPVDNDSSLVLARYHVHRKHYPKDFSIRVGSPLGGFICRQDKGKVDTIFVSNPVTGESIFLPEVKSRTF